MNYDYPFTMEEFEQANRDYGCNCGPSALAFALQVPLSEVRGQIPGFEERGYTSPTMMKSAVANLGRKFVAAVADVENMFAPQIALVRVQWTGPWTKPGANAKWAYRMTHWTACWRTNRRCNCRDSAFMEATCGQCGRTGEITSDFVFDCNGGIRSFESWKKEIVPLLTATYPRADGGWFATHIWRIQP
jgi:hypothetical protein